MSTLNAYIVYKKNGGSMEKVNFILKIVENIIMKYRHPTYKRIRSTSDFETPLRLSGRDFIEALWGKTKRRKCHVCSSQNKRTDTIYGCKECDKTLCIPYFKIYHTVKNY
ncbi:hypothetical protein A3Q56_08535 [Intoshia linei]|uniref:Uncharacterized protein n=1 Tax=Intoshia linei TaxID=1819745 RepID=A0A177ANY8_9BILA|nr:hypothetical protein A3Q56_08535 [Intoshia linei]